MVIEKLFYQFYKCIDQAFRPGIDKHSYRKGNCNKVKIFSYSDRRNIIKCTNQFCKYIENNYTNIKLIKEIKVKHVNEFLKYKSKVCSNETIKNYRYCIKKLEKMVNEYLHLKVKYIDKNTAIKSEKLCVRNIKMADIDIKLLLEEINNTNSKGILGIKVAIAFGLRAEEICKLKSKDIDIENRVLHVHEGKGKRSRNVKINSDEQFSLCKEIKEKVSDEYRVCPIKPNSLNAVIRRILIKNKIIKYSKAKTGVHAIRKYYATKDYKSNVEDIGDERIAWNITAASLGHGEGRTALKNVYVKE